MAAVAKRDVLGEVTQLVGATLKLSSSQLDSDAEFLSLGIDSIIAMELMEQVSTCFGIALTPAQFLNVSTLRELARFIEDNCDVAGLVLQPAKRAPEPVREPRQSNASLEPLLGLVKQKYAIDLTSRQWSSVDQIVDEIVSNNLEQLVRNSEVTSLFAAEAEPQGEPVIADSAAMSHSTQRRDVAIVGISCRFPDAPDPRTFWDNLIGGKRSIREIPRSRWNWEDYYASAVTPGKTVSRWGALLEDIDCFDPQFFKMTAAEARLTDPQERLLMQEVYKAIQDAGIDAQHLAGSTTGVFVGYEYAEYEQYLRRNISRIPGLLCSSASPTYYLANRLSHVLGLCGPSESVNVNCASSAVALNRACLSLIDQECDVAITGAACLHLFADDYVTASHYGLLSPDGGCAVFDDNANGFTRGEGVAAVVLKRLDSAVADNDRIYAVIKGCHQNSRGSARSLSEVKHEAITDVMTRCYARASVAPESIRYIEVNGYAKKWADSFEFEGIKNAFKATAGGKNCALGSLKGNIGHLEPVNALAALIKVALSLHHKRFPPTITRRVTNTFIDIDSPSHPFYIADAQIAFDAIRRTPAEPIRAGVSSFADSGVNVHVVLEEFLPRAENAASHGHAQPQLFVLSAKDRSRLSDAVAQFCVFLATADAVDSLTNQIYTLQTRREAMEERLAIVASSHEELRQKLQLFEQTAANDSARLQEHGIFCGNTSQPERKSMAGLITPEMIRKQMELSLQTGQWQAVATLWVHGVTIPWDLGWQGKAVRPVSLPGYPFARNRYWLELDGAEDVPVIARPAQAAADAQPQFLNSANEAMHNLLPMSALQRVESFLKQEIARHLHSATQQIDADANLIELGLSSLAIAALIGKTNELMHINLAPSVVFRYPEVRSLARYLVHSHPDKAQSLGEEKRAPDVLIPMRAKGSAVPLFAVPGADGSAVSLQLLCESLGDEQPFYALESTGLNGTMTAGGSVEAIAQLNVAALRAAQPRGPYRLLGYSNGGVIAFEMARALQEQNEAVASLLLLDTLCPAERTNRELDLIAWVFKSLTTTLGQGLEVNVQELERVPASERADYLYRMLTGYGLALPKDYFLTTYDVATTSERLCRAYALAKLPGQTAVTLFRATEGYQDAPRDYGWNRWLPEPARIVDIEASHFSIIEREPARKVAELIWRHA